MAKTIKSRILSIVLAVVMVMATITAFNFTFSAKASGIETTSYFSVVNETGVEDDVNYFDSDALVVPLKGETTIEYQRKMVIDHFEMKFEMPQNVTKMTVLLEADSYNSNGNKITSTDGTTYETKITNEIVIEKNSSKYKVYFENNATNFVEATPTATDSLKLSVSNSGVINALVNTTIVAQTDSSKNVKVADKTIAKISIKFEIAEGVEDLFKVISIDQDYNTTEHKQEFILNAENELSVLAKPYVVVNDAFANKDSNGNFVRFLDTRYSVSFTAYSIADNTINSTDIKLQETTGITIFESDTSSNYFVLSQNFGIDNGDYKVGAISVVNGSTVLRELMVKAYDSEVIDIDSDNDDANGNDAAPIYNNDSTALEIYKDKLNNSLTKEYEVNGQTITASIRIGNNEYLELPSMRELVSDEFCTYEEMSYTVHYYTPTNSGTTSSMKIPVEEAGEYKFYVSFKDANGNEMWKNDFFKYDSNNNVSGLADRYGKYVFTFTLNDDAPINVIPATQEIAYVGVEYTVSAFTIEASTNTTEYSLYYSKDGQTWSNEIDSVSTLVEPKEADYENAGCGKNKEYVDAKNWYEYCKKINFNGTTTFTPDAIGYYKLVCKVTTSLETASSEVIINVESKPTVVTPDNNWLAENVWSVVFLSVGSLSLVGIIILLVIPSKKNED